MNKEHVYLISLTLLVIFLFPNKSLSNTTRANGRDFFSREQLIRLRVYNEGLNHLDKLKQYSKKTTNDLLLRTYCIEVIARTKCEKAFSFLEELFLTDNNSAIKYCAYRSIAENCSYSELYTFISTHYYDVPPYIQNYMQSYIENELQYYIYNDPDALEAITSLLKCLAFAPKPSWIMVYDFSYLLQQRGSLYKNSVKQVIMKLLNDPENFLHGSIICYCLKYVVGPYQMTDLKPLLIKFLRENRESALVLGGTLFALGEIGEIVDISYIEPYCNDKRVGHGLDIDELFSLNICKTAQSAIKRIRERRTQDLLN